ncbi:SPOR domain-containing protein [Candidatus Berkiella cookevillensis]|uniref:Cell division protein FtsN n=1 Tax=Candidatus Berkiella cookevillensis TaxID=437022 RepID=A0A0Q9YGH3_9GAMM|nr:SPOR domain-containing protein [Candidatus Berkiella cookevillensis]MCS5709629.1 SPOR domain-containing protein [Candidatus Berkiella cookevillensis]
MTRDYAKRKRTDYPTKSVSRTAKANWNTETNSFFSPFAWLMLGIVFGLLIASVAYWKLKTEDKQPAIASNATQTHKKNAANSTTAKKGAQASEAEKKNETTRFDFYTLLPNMNIEVADTPAEGAMPNMAEPAIKPNNPNELAVSEKKNATVASENSKLTPPVPAAVAASTPTTKPAVVASLPVATAETTNKGPFIIQVASFRKREQADTLKAKLALSGFESNIQSIKIGSGETWYRLYLGPFNNRLAAENTHQKLESEQKINGLVLKINV